MNKDCRTCVWQHPMGWCGCDGDCNYEKRVPNYATTTVDYPGFQQQESCVNYDAQGVIADEKDS